MYISSHTVRAAHATCSAPTPIPCISRGSDPPVAFWNVLKGASLLMWIPNVLQLVLKTQDKQKEKKRNMCCTSWIGQSDKTEAEKKKKEKKEKKCERGKKNLKVQENMKRKKNPNKTSHYHPAWAPTQNKGTFTFMQADRSSPRWWIPPLKDNADHPCTFLPPWDGVLQQTSCAGFDLERSDGHSELNDTGNTQVQLQAQRRAQVPLGYTTHTYQRHTEASGPTINTFMSDPDLGVRRHSALDGWSYITATAEHLRPPKESILCSVDHYMNIIDPGWLLGTMKLLNHRCY